MQLALFQETFLNPDTAERRWPPALNADVISIDLETETACPAKAPKLIMA
jgi:hypothetical protein